MDVSRGDLRALCCFFDRHAALQGMADFFLRFPMLYQLQDFVFMFREEITAQ